MCLQPMVLGMVAVDCPVMMTLALPKVFESVYASAVVLPSAGCLFWSSDEHCICVLNVVWFVCMDRLADADDIGKGMAIGMPHRM